ncbi:MAG: N-acetylmuramic acid 6-phosphate etherase [SAR324 cluster bacterium]|jgi:N-acetylmuramic acid 6-phosphate etherase|nr:N-acetylmuramic acid 6-phosphate etherase [SAR324 cluster bacterium]MCH2267062.1 N-acetylmuramic acid 6-phosphate etherase [SAR324 cluster bacterium]
MSALEIVQTMNSEDERVAESVKQSLPEIAEAVELIAERLLHGGRLFYVGAGTSGRLGVMDASECPPTFGVSPEMVQGIIAGGVTALTDEVEGAEDDVSAGETSMKNVKINNQDVVLGISASGTTPFVLAAIAYAGQQGAVKIGLACIPKSPLLENVAVAICVQVGQEVVAESTRLKAGTAQKMVLNMLSTATMVKLGKVYQNRMVNLQASNIKLVRRAEEMVAELGEVSLKTAAELFLKSGHHVKTAIVMAKLKISGQEAGKSLEAVDENLSKIL